MRHSRNKNLRTKIITIKDIARETGFSTGTVSRALNDEEGVGEDARLKILKLAKDMNYYPNMQARGLVGQKTNSIGVVIPQTSQFGMSNPPYFSELLNGIAIKANEANFFLVFSFFGPESYSRLYFQKLAGGLIILSNRVDDFRIVEAKKMQVPMVLIPGDPNHKEIPSVDGDSFSAVHQIIDHLSKLGHKRIGFLHGPQNSKYTIERLESFFQSLREYELPFVDSFLREYDFTQEMGYEKMKDLLALKVPPTAVLMMHDYTYLGVFRAAREMGFRVPEDLSVVGFGDMPFAYMTDPPLTTIKIPFREIGYKAAEMIINVIKGKKLQRRHVIFPNELIIRKSTNMANVKGN